MANQILLGVKGLNYSGWNKISVTRTMESLTGSFSIDLVGGENSNTNLIKKGDPCKIYIKDDIEIEIQVMNGYIDEVRRSRTSSNTSLSISGRDKTLDLVDCSAIFKPSNTWLKKKLPDIAKDLCRPFGIKLIDESKPSEPFKKITIQSGESPFALIERICRQVGVLPITNTYGQLLLTYAREINDLPVIDLIDGVNILDIEEIDSLKNQFSEYTVKGQNSGSGLMWQKSDTTSFKGIARDLNVKRYRPLVIMAESKSNKKLVQERASWEAQVRAGRSRVHNITVRNWFQRPGTDTKTARLWSPNTLVNLKSNPWGLNEKRLITSVSYSLDTTGGRVTQLTLKHPNTYKISPSNEVQL